MAGKPLVALHADDRLWLLVEQSAVMAAATALVPGHPFAIARERRLTHPGIATARQCGVRAAGALAADLDRAAKTRTVNRRPVVALVIVSTFFYSDEREGRARAFFVEREAYRAMRRLFATLAKLSVEETRKEAA